MPTYQLKCTKCEHEFTDVHKMMEDHPPCPKCSSLVKVHMTTPPNFVFSGTGWASKEIKEERRLQNVL